MKVVKNRETMSSHINTSSSHHYLVLFQNIESPGTNKFKRFFILRKDFDLA